MNRKFIAVKFRYINKLFETVNSDNLRLKIEEIIGKSDRILLNEHLKKYYGGLTLYTKYQLIDNVRQRKLISIENIDNGIDNDIDLEIVINSFNSYLGKKDAVISYQDITSNIHITKV